MRPCVRIWSAFFGVATALMVCGEAQALSVRHHLQVLAWSSDGANALLSISARGPERGGSLSYRVISGEGEPDLEVMVSDTMSPGDGTTPQQVSKRQCVRQLRKLRSTLRRLSFEGVQTRSRGCSKKSRGELLQVSEAAETTVRKGRLKPSAAPNVDMGLWLTVENQTLTLRQHEKILFKRDSPFSKNALGTISPTLRLLLIISHGSYGDTLMATLRNPTGKPGDWVEGASGP